MIRLISRQNRSRSRSTAGDELSALRDPRVKADESYMNPLILSKVITMLGTLPEITPEVIEGLFVADMEFLQDMYDTINKVDKPQIPSFISSSMRVMTTVFLVALPDWISLIQSQNT